MALYSTLNRLQNCREFFSQNWFSVAYSLTVRAYLNTQKNGLFCSLYFILCAVSKPFPYLEIFRQRLFIFFFFSRSLPTPKTEFFTQLVMNFPTKK